MNSTEQDHDVALSQSYPGHWRGRWIWDSGEPYPFHYFLMIRRSFELREPAAGARIRITCSGRYILYVNGVYMGRGPARSAPQWKSYDVHNLTHLLRAGRNTVAVLGYHYGCQNNYTRDDRAGFWAQIELPEAAGGERVIGTDGQWKVRQAQGWDRNVDLINSCLGATEVYDARLDPADWTMPEFDDKGWEIATLIAPGWGIPWSYLEARRTPLMLERERLPVAVAATGEIREYSHHINGLADNLSVQQVPERLASELYVPAEFTRVTNPGGVLKKDDPAMTVPYAGATRGGARSPYVIFDFGRPLFGFPRVRLNGPAGGIVEMTYGMDLVAGRVPPVADGCRFGDRYVMRDGEQAWQLFEYKAFRYLQIVFRNMPEPVQVDAVSVVEYVYPAERRGSFTCSDRRLTRLWEAAVHTAYLHLEDTVICDNVRERRAFCGGDAAHSLFGVFAGYGDLAVTDWYLRQITRARTIDGMQRAIYPGTESAAGDCSARIPKKATVFENPEIIPQGGVLTAALLAEHYRHFGKMELLRDLYPDLVSLARWYGRHADAKGLLYSLPYWNWCDWTATEMRGANFETNACYHGLLTELAVMADDLGYPADAEEYRRRAGVVRDALQRLHWNEERGLFADSWIEDEAVDLFTENANGMALYFGIAATEQVERIVSALKDPKSDIVRGSPLYIAYTFEGLAARGHLDEALRQMSERYAAMVDEGIASPTMWERWSLPEGGAGADSKVHSGGCGVAWILSKYVLGVQPLTTGYGRCRIAPVAGGLEWARGVVPTVRGDIRVEWRRTERQMALEVSLPDGLDTELAVPWSGGEDIEIEHNGVRRSVRRRDSVPDGLRLLDGNVLIDVRGGHHRVCYPCVT
jgi:alpha-L-rhamnosidase